MKRWDVINRFITRESKYLELGVDEGECWDRIQTPWKIGVDIVPNLGRTTFVCSSHQFLDAWRGMMRFNVIFIDASHHEHDVLRDVQLANQVIITGGVMILHDCLPTDMARATDIHPGKNPDGRLQGWYGTVWRAAVRLAYIRELSFCIVDTEDGGCGILQEGSQDVPSIPIEEALDPDFFFENARAKIFTMIE